jgi:hypothetical protein
VWRLSIHLRADGVWPAGTDDRDAPGPAHDLLSSERSGNGDIYLATR